MDVAEIGFEALAGKMPQRDERFLVSASMLAQMALHLGIAARVTVLIADPPEHLSGGVPLLGRGVLVVDSDPVDDRLERPQLGGRTVPGQRLGMWVRMHEGMADSFSRVSELAGDLPDGHAIASSPPDCAMVVHGNHVLSLHAVNRSV